MQPNAGSQTVDIFRGSATVLLCWLASLLGLGLACFQLLGEPIGVWPWLDRIVWSQDFTLLVLMIISTLAFTTIRNVGQINRYSRDLLLRKMLPLDAANAVLQGEALKHEAGLREGGLTWQHAVSRVCEAGCWG